jgi:hypothetical protein
MLKIPAERYSRSMLYMLKVCSSVVVNSSIANSEILAAMKLDFNQY